MLIHCRQALAGLPHLVGGLVVGLRHRMFGPGQRDEDVVALLHSGACPRLVALQSQPQVGGQAQCRMRVGVTAGPGDRLAVGLGRVLPRSGDAVVVESRLAVHHQLDCAAHASHRAQQDVLGVPIHRCAAVRAGPGLDVVPRSHHQRIAHDHPAGMGLPGGLQDQAAGQIPPRGRAPTRHTGPAGSGPRRGPGSRRRRWGSRGAARTAIPPSRPTRSGRCSRSRTGTRSRRSAERGSATTRCRHTAPAPSR